ncbi:MAG: ATP-binding cassette domain-containing protein [Alphaproteobacteria bacterium]|nr:ATP-binding cassette domain-containing protein [Alphaproteobacteria bacterium]
MTESSLSIQNLSVAYAGKPAINNINLEIKSGEIYGLMGLNGAGKTTIIKSILGLREPDTGDIRILGQNKDSKQSKAQLSYLPEKFEPPWFLTGMEFLKFCIDLYKQPFHENEMIEAAKALALEEGALKRRMNTYSKGMRQKLGLMGTLLTGCSLFILDEPMSGLDPKARALVKKMILDMKGKDRTIFLSSHILADMDEICDRVALLHDQTIQFVGKPQELRAATNADNLEQAFLDFIEHKRSA